MNRKGRKEMAIFITGDTPVISAGSCLQHSMSNVT